jgi:6-phosphogluconate dehydrogenase
MFESYLLEITGQIFNEENGNSQVLNKILDSAGAKGTGKWTVQIASDLGVPVGAIYSALELRKLSNNKGLRVSLNKKYQQEIDEINLQKDKGKIISDAKKALYASILVAYIQGYEVIAAASRDLQYTKPHQQVSEENNLGNYNSKELDTNIDLVEVSRVWKAGCIIRSNLLGLFEEIFMENKDDMDFTLLESSKIIEMFDEFKQSWKSSVELANKHCTPYQTIGSSLNYLHSFTSVNLPANLIQAQRDLFGAHTFKRKDSDGTFHHHWGDDFSVTADFKK